jgi:hypothetical protein
MSRQYTDAMLLDAAAQRARGHNAKGHIRPLVAGGAVLGHWLWGLVGERAFSEYAGLPMDLTFRPSASDGRVDFITPKGATVDVKTALRPYGLWVEAGKPMADVFVLAVVRPDAGMEADLVGWATRAQVAAVAPVPSRYGVVNHCLPIAQLHQFD